MAFMNFICHREIPFMTLDDILFSILNKFLRIDIFQAEFSQSSE